MTRLGAVVNEFVALMQWSDVVEDDEQAGACRLGARIEVDGQECKVFVETDEGTDSIAVFIHLPFRVRAAKRVQACVLINAINRVTRIGRLEMDMSDGELRGVASADVQGAEPAGRFVAAMLRANAGMLGYWMWALAAMAFTERDAADILEEEARRDELVNANAAMEAQVQALGGG